MWNYLSTFNKKCERINKTWNQRYLLLGQMTKTAGPPGKTQSIASNQGFIVLLVYVTVLSELLFRSIFCAYFYWQICHFSEQTKHTLYMATFKHLMYFLYLMRLIFLIISNCDQAEFYKSFYWKLILLFFALQRLATTNQLSKKWNRTIW